MDAALLLLALLGHAALWVNLINRLHARNLPRWLIRLGTVGCFVMMAAAAGGAGLVVFAADPAVFLRLRAGEFVRSAPLGVWAYLLFCCCGGAVALLHWLWRHALHRPPAVSRSSHSHSLLDRDAPAPETAEHPHHFLVRLPGNQSLHLDLTRRAIEVPRLPPAWEGLSLVHLSDFHFNGRVGKPYFQELVRLSNELQPDLVLLTGDLVDRLRCIDWIPDTLSRLSARYGVYCVLGNRDIRTDAARVSRAIEESGLCYLGGRHVQIESPRPAGGAGGQRAALAAGGRPGAQPAAASGRAVPHRLAHSPDQLQWARDHDVDLLVAGHTHGGQIRLPLIGPIFTPSRRGLRYSAGVFHAPPTIMHVTRGVSGSVPLRWNCTPEMAQLVLHKAGTGDQGPGI